jgi:hypothetical protein
MKMLGIAHSSMQLFAAQAHHPLQEPTQAWTRQQLWPVLQTGPARPAVIRAFVSAFHLTAGVVP